MYNNRSRRQFLGRIGTFFTTTVAAKWAPRYASAQAPTDANAPYYAYVGCFTTNERGASGNGINVFRVNATSGIWGHIQLVPDLVNPSFLAIDHERRFLYSVHGDEDYATAFSIDATNGRLTFLNREATGGTNGVHLAVDPSNRYLVVSNYASGSMAVLPINTDGSLAPRSDLVELPGAPGPHPTQQTSSHPHHNPFDRDGRFFIVADKGLDRVFVFRLDTVNGRLIRAERPSIATAPGAGPRHAAFHPTMSFAYVLNELDSTLVTYAYDAENGGLTQRQRVSTVPDGFAGENTTAEIAIDRRGRFLYCSNRGHNSIAALSVDRLSGELTPLAWTPSGGVRPRYFGLDPAGTLLYACNERSHNIVAFRVDPATGALNPTGQVVETASPVTIVFREVDA